MPIPFDRFIESLEETDAGSRQSAVERFLGEQVCGFPITESDRAHFVYRGRAGRVSVAGDHNFWTPSEPMHHPEGTDFFYTSHHFEPDARIDYKFLLDGAHWILDPLNPRTTSGGFGPNSVLVMPAYPPAMLPSGSAPLQHGNLVEEDVPLAAGGARHVALYVPLAGGEPFSFLCVLDGTDYLGYGALAQSIDDMIGKRSIRPVAALFVSSDDRPGEYRLHRRHEFARLLLQEIIPAAARRVAITPDPARRAILGASDGGHAALMLAFEHPECFGNCGAQSPTISDELRHLVHTTRPGARVRIQCGTYDLKGFLTANRECAGEMESRGYDVRMREVHEGHSWGNWSIHVKELLREFFDGGGE